MLKVDFYKLGTIKDNDLSFAVVMARYNGKWIFCKHKKRDTWEIPGGHREVNESIEECARRELIEETGARDFTLKPLCIYSVKRDNKKDFGQIFYAEVESLGELPDSEMEKIDFFDKSPENLTHPQIQPHIFNKVLEIIK